MSQFTEFLNTDFLSMPSVEGKIIDVWMESITCEEKGCQKEDVGSMPLIGER